MQTAPALRVAVIEDDELIRSCYAQYLGRQPELDCLVAAGSVEEFFEWVGATPRPPDMVPLPPDVVLTDIGLPGKSGLEGIRLIKQQFPKTEVLMITVYTDEERIFQAICAGASGYLLKNTPLPDIKQALLDVAAGGSVMSPSIARRVLAHFRPEGRAAQAGHEHLTERERHIAQFIVDGLSYKLAAARLGLSLDTVRGHLKSVYRKLHISSKGELLTRHFRGELW